MPKDEQSLELSPTLILRAYAAGVFPMADGAETDGVFWVDPRQRGVFPLDAFHVPRRLARRIRAGGFEVTVDRDFDAVIDACADRDETWINGDIRRLYLALHRMGYAHSVEVRMDGALAGGLYGVRMGAAFFGESMFHRRTDASKIALVYLVARLRVGGFRLLDSQFTTDHLARFGATSVPRERYHGMLDLALREVGDFDALPQGATPDEVLQASTQTS
ncbi:leucyl/phenylalanyl-tRNA--protein transferase [Rubrimonas cliftonensis]|uniref:Leucyl/phenylalanyl-tRNA--protein transferase n=1 Tax=Rubrimonas cliftonensis TaxID=89524 RepID=A0A1H3YK04_9RHOB|nr:leucyl/phenylalanyl-tRNA--protein transferase [Rubrimonas cliftonensis]SEA11268.1 leucyl/phenylalanyl-tRNA--protein transferase [Rubrimonas cliftonensis]